MPAALFFALALVVLCAALAAWFSVRSLRGANALYFLVAWLTGELAPQLFVLQLAGVLLLLGVRADALTSAPGQLGLLACGASSLLLLACQLRAGGARDEVRAFAKAHGLALPNFQLALWHGFLHPFRMRRAGVRVLRNIEYGPALPGDGGRRNLLDVVLPEGPSAGLRRPVLLQVHGGGWVIGDKEDQGRPLMAEMAARGWVNFAPNYRLSPKATFPDHIVDVKRALAWVRAHAGEYGADPNFVCITGGSAGGHLAALAALSPNDARFQPGFEDADTRVQAAVPFYGVYDWLDAAQVRGANSYIPFLARRVLKCSPRENRELWEAGAPLLRVNAAAPPFLVIHGTHDSLVYVEEARAFVRALEEKSQQPVLYLELAGAQHAFDLFHSLRSASAVRAVAAFLENCHRTRGEH